MFSRMYSARGLAASLTLCCFVLSIPGPTVMAQVASSSQVETITLEPSETLIANHGTEGTSGASGLSGASAAPVITAVKGHATKSVVSTSLWGNMLLSMAYQMDPELQRIIQKLGRVNAATLLSITGVSGLGLAQSIYALNQVKSQHIDVEEDGAHEAVHIPADSKVPATLGIIGSGVTLATLGLNAVMNKHYSRKLTQQQLAIKERVEHALTHLKSSENPEHTRQELVSLVGEEATDEFLSLWQATHPSISSR